MSEHHPDFAPDIEVIDTPHGAYQMRSDILIHVRSAAGDHTAEQAQAWVDMVRDLRVKTGRKIRMLLDVRATRNTEPQAREVYNSPENSGNIAGAAMVIDGGISRVIGNFALRLTKLDAPTRLFNSVSEAIEWLESLDDE